MSATRPEQLAKINEAINTLKNTLSTTHLKFWHKAAKEREMELLNSLAERMERGAPLTKHERTDLEKILPSSAVITHALDVLSINMNELLLKDIFLFNTNNLNSEDVALILEHLEHFDKIYKSLRGDDQGVLNSAMESILNNATTVLSTEEERIATQLTLIEILINAYGQLQKPQHFPKLTERAEENKQALAALKHDLSNIEEIKNKYMDDLKLQISTIEKVPENVQTIDRLESTLNEYKNIYEHAKIAKDLSATKKIVQLLGLQITILKKIENMYEQYQLKIPEELKMAIHSKQEERDSIHNRITPEPDSEFNFRM